MVSEAMAWNWSISVTGSAPISSYIAAHFKVSVRFTRLCSKSGSTHVGVIPPIVHFLYAMLFTVFDLELKNQPCLLDLPLYLPIHHKPLFRGHDQQPQGQSLQEHL